jgi:hypothetical protein
MHPIKESSQEDMLKLSPNEPIGTQKFIMANVAMQPTDARPPPVPPKSEQTQIFTQQEILYKMLDSDTPLFHAVTQTSVCSVDVVTLKWRRLVFQISPSFRSSSRRLHSRLMRESHPLTVWKRMVSHVLGFSC